MAKAWGHSRSGIEGLRPHLISAQAADNVSSLSSASSAKPQWRYAAESAAESPAQEDMAATLSKRQQQMQLQQQSRTSGDKKPSFMRTKRPTDLRIQQAGFLIPLFYLRESQIVSQSLGEWNLSNHEQAIIDGSRSLLLENHGKNFPQQSPSRIARNDVRVFAAHAFLYRAEFSAIGNKQRRSGGTHMGHDILQADALLRRLDDSQTRYRESPQFGRRTNSQCTNSRNNVVQSGKCLGLNNTNCVLSYTSVGDPASNRS